MSKPELFYEPLPSQIVRRLAEESFGEMVKFVVDLKRERICVGGELHSDEEAMLLADGSHQDDLWGANYYLDDPSESRFVYTSMINIRPSQNNRKQEIESAEIRDSVRRIALHYLENKAS